MNKLALSSHDKNKLLKFLSNIGCPYDDLEGFLLSIYPIFAGLPRAILCKLFDFRNNPHAYGALVLENFPIDEELPPTPADGQRSQQKKTFISEACVLGVAQMLGQPVGYYDEKKGEVIQILCPVRKEACSTSSESSEIELGFHTDFNFDKDNPDTPFNRGNADYIVLMCLRGAQNSDACTLYADARDICRQLTPAQLIAMRRPLFQFAASYSFTGTCGTNKIWSVPCPLIKGPDAFPEISIDLLCGVRALTDEAEEILGTLREVCGRPGVAQSVCLGPGQLLLIDNRKGAHARTPFVAHYDGYDRWLQRVYVRRSLWELRKRSNENLRVF